MCPQSHVLVRALQGNRLNRGCVGACMSLHRKGMGERDGGMIVGKSKICREDWRPREGLMLQP